MYHSGVNALPAHVVTLCLEAYQILVNTEATVTLWRNQEG